MKKISNIVNITFMFVCIIILGCQSDRSSHPHEYLQKINNIPVSKTLYVFKVDLDQNIVDTLVMRTLKYDENNNLVFEKNFQLKSGLISINYYDSLNGMFYSEIKNKNEKFSDFITVIDKKGLIVSANYNIYEGSKKVDSVIMSYNYTFSEGKKTKLIIDSGDNFNTIEYYNPFEKPTLNFSLSYNDTVERTRFIYDKNTILRKKIFKHFSKDEEIVYMYDDSNNIIEENYFKNNKKEFSVNYSKDEKGNYLSYTKYE